jgi:ABC-type uncharacterized transport system substrate-binding protein
MKRRNVIAAIGAGAAWPLLAHAQPQGEIRRIAILLAVAENDPFVARFFDAAEQKLQELGWKLESNLRVERRVAGLDLARLQAYAAELVALKPEVVLVLGRSEVQALRRESPTLPIVFASSTDPVADGLVKSLARPGGSTTGFTNYEASIATKWLGLLKEMAPSLRRVAMVLNLDSASLVDLRRTVIAAAPAFDVALTPIGDANARAITEEIEGFAPGVPGGLLVFPGPSTAAHRELIVALAARLVCPRSIRFPDTQG